MRLGQELAGDFFVIWFDAETSLTETANHFDVLLGMGSAVHASAEAAGLHPDRRLAEQLTRSLAKFIRKYEERKGFTLRLDQVLQQVFAIAIGAGAVALGGPPGMLFAGAAVLPAFKATRLELNVGDEHVRSLEMPANRQELVGALNAIIDGVQRKCQKPLLVVTDGLDKVPPARARKLFADSALLTEPACALVYAAPIEFKHRLWAGQAENLFDDFPMLPNPPVHEAPPAGDGWRQERISNPDGLKVMEAVVARRLERIAREWRR